MTTVRKQVIGIYVDRATRQWVVRDDEGNYWFLPAGDDPWAERQPFSPSEDSDLEPVPGHYRYLLGLPH